MWKMFMQFLCWELFEKTVFWVFWEIPNLLLAQKETTYFLLDMNIYIDQKKIKEGRYTFIGMTVLVGKKE